MAPNYEKNPAKLKLQNFQLKGNSLWAVLLPPIYERGFGGSLRVTLSGPPSTSVSDCLWGRVNVGKRAVAQRVPPPPRPPPGSPLRTNKHLASVWCFGSFIASPSWGDGCYYSHITMRGQPEVALTRPGDTGKARSQDSRFLVQGSAPTTLTVP